MNHSRSRRPRTEESEDRKLRKIFLDNIGTLSERDIQKAFETYGAIEEVARIQDRRNPDRVFAFVVMQHAADTIQATKEMFPVIRGHKCKCMLAALGQPFSGHEFFHGQGLLTETNSRRNDRQNGGRRNNNRGRRPSRGRGRGHNNSHRDDRRHSNRNVQQFTPQQTAHFPSNVVKVTEEAHNNNTARLTPMGSSVQSNQQAADSSAEPDGQANLPHNNYSNASSASTVVSVNTPPLQHQQQQQQHSMQTPSNVPQPQQAHSYQPHQMQGHGHSHGHVHVQQRQYQQILQVHPQQMMQQQQTAGAPQPIEHYPQQQYVNYNAMRPSLGGASSYHVSPRTCGGSGNGNGNGNGNMHRPTATTPPFPVNLHQQSQHQSYGYPGSGLPHAVSNGHTPTVQIAGMPPMANGYPVLPMAMSNPCGRPIVAGAPSPLSNSTISTPSPTHFSPLYANGSGAGTGYTNPNGRRYPNRNPNMNMNMNVSTNTTQSPSYPIHVQFQGSYSHHASWQQQQPRPPTQQTVAGNQGTGTVHQTAEASVPPMDPRAASHHTIHHQAVPDSRPPPIRQQSAPDQRQRPRVHFADQTQSNVDGPEGQTPVMVYSQSHRLPLASSTHHHAMEYHGYMAGDCALSGASSQSASSDELANQAVDDALPSLQNKAYAQTAHVVRARQSRDDGGDEIASASPDAAVPKLQFAQTAWAPDLLEKIEAPALLAFDVDENDDGDNEEDIFPEAPGQTRPALQMAITAPVAGVIINGMKAVSRGPENSKLKHSAQNRASTTVEELSKLPDAELNEGFTMLNPDDDDLYGDDELVVEDVEDDESVLGKKEEDDSGDDMMDRPQLGRS